MRQLKTAILEAARSIARRKGFHNITQAEVAELSKAAVGTIHYHFGDMDGLRSAVMDHAIVHEELAIVAQGLAQNHPSLRKASKDLKRRAAQCLA
jgi:AcrR family transcriptional regulator